MDDTSELVACLRDLAESYPEDIFPTPPPERRATDAAAAYVMRRLAVGWFKQAADKLETQDRLLRRLCGVADHGGPRNWRAFIDDADERALVVGLDSKGTLPLSEVASR